MWMQVYMHKGVTIYIYIIYICTCETHLTHHLTRHMACYYRFDFSSHTCCPCIYVCNEWNMMIAIVNNDDNMIMWHICVNCSNFKRKWSSTVA